MHSCPVFFMRCMWVLVRLLTLFPNAPGAHILNGRALVLPEHRQAVAVAIESDPHALPPLSPYSSAVYLPYQAMEHPNLAGTEGFSPLCVGQGFPCLVACMFCSDVSPMAKKLLLLRRTSRMHCTT